jgi:hypothetical protein
MALRRLSSNTEPRIASIALVAGLTAASGLWVLGDMPGRPTGTRMPIPTTQSRSRRAARSRIEGAERTGEEDERVLDGRGAQVVDAP